MISDNDRSARRAKPCDGIGDGRCPVSVGWSGGPVRTGGLLQRLERGGLREKGLGLSCPASALWTLGQESLGSGASCALGGVMRSTLPPRLSALQVSGNQKCRDIAVSLRVNASVEIHRPRGTAFWEEGTINMKVPEVGTNSAGFLGTELSGSGSFQGSASSGWSPGSERGGWRGTQGPDARDRGLDLPQGGDGEWSEGKRVSVLGLL